jgi:heme/copper-type cytochrome/quinol oxidase subunit 4
MCTFCIVAFSCAIAIFVPSIGDAMTILGATTNSGIGFLLPIVFYLKIEEKRGGRWTNMKVMSYVVFATICICSIITLYSYVDKKISG